MKAKSSLPWAGAGSKKGSANAKANILGALHEELAVKEAYVAARSRWLSRMQGAKVAYKPPHSYDGTSAVYIDGEAIAEKPKRSEWAALARWLAENQYPVSYIAFQFEQLPSYGRPPEPKQLSNPKYVEMWQKSFGKIDMELTIQLRLDQDTFSRELACQEIIGERRFRAILLVLGNDSLAISPLFRFCVCRRMKHKSMLYIAKNYALEAATQFMQAPQVYLRVWGDWIPAGFCAEADKLYRRWLRGDAGN